MSDDRLIVQFQDLAAAYGTQWDARMHKAQQQVTIDFARRGLAASSGHALGKVDAAKEEMFTRVADLKSAARNLPALSQPVPIDPNDLQEAFRIVASARTRMEPNLYIGQLQAMGMQNFNGDPVPQAQREVEGHIAAALGEIGALAYAHADRAEQREIEIEAAVAAKLQAFHQGESVKVQASGIWFTVVSNLVSAVVGALLGYLIAKH